MLRFRPGFAVLLACCVVGGARTAGAQDPEYQEVEVTNGGAVAGRIRYFGERTSGTIRATRDTDACGTEPKSDHMIVTGEDGGLAGVIVSLEDVPAGRPRSTAPDADMEIVQCQFRPHVLSVTVSGKLTLRNTDGILHRPRGDIGDQPIFQWGMPLPQRLPKKIRAAGMMRVRCTLHKESVAWVGAFSHPYHAVTDETGAFRLEGVPPATYTLHYWHEVFGEQTRTVTVEAGATASADGTYD